MKHLIQIAFKLEPTFGPLSDLSRNLSWRMSLDKLTRDHFTSLEEGKGLTEGNVKWLSKPFKRE